MLSRVRVKKIFKFEKADRPAIFDLYREDTIKKWNKEGFPKGLNPADYFDHDIRLFGFDQSLNSEAFAFERSLMDAPSSGEKLSEGYGRAKEAGKFLCFSFLGPFEHIRSIYGTETVLEKMASEPAFIKALFIKSARLIIDAFTAARDMGYSFDGAWMWEDIAYKDGLLFSVEDYIDKLFGPHKVICDFFKHENMPSIMHADGNLNKMIPQLLEVGIAAIHPLESAAGMDLLKLIDLCGNKMVLVGNVEPSIMKGGGKGTLKKIREKLRDASRAGGYIYSSDQPISPDISLENYKSVLALIKEEGSGCPSK